MRIVGARAIKLLPVGVVVALCVGGAARSEGTRQSARSTTAATRLAQLFPGAGSSAKPAAPADAPPAKHYGAGKPYGPDILGLRLGMSPDEVRDTVAKIGEPLPIEEKTARPFEGGEPSLAAFTIGGPPPRTAADRFNRTPVGPSNTASGQIDVEFTMGDAVPLAYRITRHVTYRQESRPLVKTTFDALATKYGPQSVSETNGRLWIFSVDGKQITTPDLVGLDALCAHDVVPGQRSELPRASRCGELLEARIGRPNKTDPIVGDLTVGAVDLGAWVRDVAGRDRLAKERGKTIEDNAGAQKPKL